MVLFESCSQRSHLWVQWHMESWRTLLRSEVVEVRARAMSTRKSTLGSRSSRALRNEGQDRSSFGILCGSQDVP